MGKDYKTTFGGVFILKVSKRGYIFKENPSGITYLVKAKLKD